MTWRLLDLNAVDGYVMTNLYEAVGVSVSKGESPNTLILNHPEKPFANIGYHQQMEKEIDIEYCKLRGFDLVRRSIGGGAILDGPWEQDYFVIIDRDDVECPSEISKFYEKFLRPCVYAINKYGLKGRYKPVNDVLIGDKKVSGNGAVTINNANVLAGDILLDLPLELMARILRVPSEKFRGKLAKSMSEWLTSLKKELGFTPSGDEVKAYLVEGFEEELGIEFERRPITSKERTYLERLLDERKRKRWIFMKTLEHEQLFSKIEAKATKVKGGVIICEGTYKANKLVRITMEILDDRIREIAILGDFFTQPYIGALSQLERELVNASVEEEALKSKMRKALNKIGLKIFGASSDDFVRAIIKAKESTP